VRWLAGTLPGLPLWVCGGVGLDQIGAYPKAGANAVGLDTALFPPDAVEAGDFARISELARKAVSGLAAVGVARQHAASKKDGGRREEDRPASRRVEALAHRLQ
jgi:hypothetical protein